MLFRTAMSMGLVASVLTSACTSPAPEPVDVEAEEAALNAALESFGQAAMAGDMEAAAAFMTEDFEIREPGMNADRAQWLATVQEADAAGTRVAAFETRTDDYFLHGDVAYEVGEYDETFTMGESEQAVEGYYFIRWERGGDGVWRMDRLVAGPRALPDSAPM